MSGEDALWELLFVVALPFMVLIGLLIAWIFMPDGGDDR